MAKSTVTLNLLKPVTSTSQVEILLVRSFLGTKRFSKIGILLCSYSLRKQRRISSDKVVLSSNFCNVNFNK